MRCLLLALLLVLPMQAAAEPYPAHDDPHVNDLAGVIDDAAETRIRAGLQSLKERTGVEASVLTIMSRAEYDFAPSVEAFATGLFNAWGLGGAARNDGILILVVTTDREMRIELGAGYDQGYDVVAKSIIDRYFLPAFGEGRLSDGIETGTAETVARIAERHAARLPPEQLPAAGGGGIAGWLFGGVAALAGMAIVFGRGIGNLALGLRACPQCGARGLHRHSDIVQEATAATPGLRRVSVTCPACGHSERRDVAIAARRGASAGSGFGGGRSSGGGATGRW